MQDQTSAYDKPVRIYELAKQLQVPNKDLIQWLQKHGHENIKTHSNTLAPDEATRALSQWREEHAPKPPTPAPTEKTSDEAPQPTTPRRPERRPTGRGEDRRRNAGVRSDRPSRPRTGTAQRSDERSERPRRVVTTDRRGQPASSSRGPRVAYSSRTSGPDTTRTYHSPSGRRPTAGAPRDGRPAERGRSRTGARPAGAPQRRRDSQDRRAGGRSGPGRETATEPLADDATARAQARRRLDKERDRARAELRERAREREERARAERQKPIKKRDGEDLLIPAREEIVEVTEGSTIAQVAETVGVKANAIIAHLFKLGIMATINEPLNLEVLEKLEETFRFVAKKRRTVEEQFLEKVKVEDDPALLRPRAPVVTIMGHVDHGKTTLLDAVRETNVADREAGQITQHIGAYDVRLKDARVVFLDTPGHEAFTAMRARGAQVTDVVVLVVAADDGVMPQTIEAINHARAANVPIVVAVNKIDVPNANVDRVLGELAQHGLTPEDWGGDTVVCQVSAKQRTGIDELLEYLALESELLELKANPARPAVGTVIEAQLSKGRGPVATVLVQNGTLHLGEHFVAGRSWGRVRALFNDRGERVEEAGPSTPVEVVGFHDLPSPGDRFMVAGEADVRDLAEDRSEAQRAKRLATRPRITLDELHTQIQEGQIKELNVIIKTDVEGSIEPLRGALSQFDTEEVRVAVIHSGVGAITETDVMLAAASSAVIVGFNVRPTPEASAAAEAEGIDIRTYDVIYNVVNDIRAALEGLLEPDIAEQVLGRATVREVFRVPRFGLAAGCYVNNGRMVRGMKVRVLRDNRVVHDGTVDSLRRFKEDAREVTAGYECGLAMASYNDFKVGDVLECYTHEEVARSLPKVGN